LRSAGDLRKVTLVDLDAWWPLVEQQSRDWLIAHNGEALSTAVLHDIARVDGSLPSNGWWGLEKRPGGHYLSDAGVDWIETVANGEVPRPPADR